MFSLLRSRPLLGLDLGPKQLRLLELNKKRKGLSFGKTFSLNLPEVEKNQHWDLVQQTLAEWVQQTRSQGRGVALALPSQVLYRKKIQLSSELAANKIPAEILRLLPVYFPQHSPEDLNFDFAILHCTPEFYEILVVATEREYLQNYVQTVNQAGLKVALVDGEIYALARAAKIGLEYLNEKPVHTAGLFYLQGEQLQLLIYQHKSIIFHQLFSLTPDSREITASLLESFKVAWQQALRQHPNLQIAALSLAGDVNFLADLCSLLEKEVLIPTAMALIPCVSLETKMDTSFLLAYGLAVREASICWS